MPFMRVGYFLFHEFVLERLQHVMPFLQALSAVM
jgi:hypothetical protein